MIGLWNRIRMAAAPFRLRIGLTLMLMTLLFFFMLTSGPSFLSWRIYASFLSTIPPSAILATGLTLLVIAGEMDLSFPSVMAISGLAFAATFQASASPALAMGAALATGAVAGLVNGVVVVLIGVPSMVATIGTQFLWRGAATLLSNGLAISIIEIRGTFGHQLMVGRIADMVPAQAVWAVAVAMGLWLLLDRHVLGDHILFIGDNRTAAQALGVPVAATRVALFVLMGLVAALASILVCLEMANWWPTHGDGYLLLVFAAIFIGGTSVFGGQGTIYGTMIGSLIIGILEAGIIAAGWSGLLTRLIYGLIIVVAVSIHAWTSKFRSIRN